MEKNKKIFKSLKIGFFVLCGLFLYAYGFKVTKVELNSFRDENRQTSRERVMRRLASPRIFEYDQEEFIVIAPVIVPCVDFTGALPEIDPEGPQLVVTPSCANPGDLVEVEGFNFPSRVEGPVSFIPSTDASSTLALVPSIIRADDDGYFKISFKIPQRESEDYQLIRATLRRNVGLPYLSEAAHETWEKIIETVFMAFIATSIGTAVSIPVSFFAARNLMKDVKSPLSRVALSILGWLLGAALGIKAAELLLAVGELTTGQVLFSVIALLLSVGLVIWLMRYVFNPHYAQKIKGKTLVISLIYAGVFVFVFLALFFFANVSQQFGKYVMAHSSDSLIFLGNFPFQIGDLIREAYTAVVVLSLAGIFSSLLGRVGQRLSETLSILPLKAINFFAASAAFAAVAAAIGWGIDWLYQIDDLTATLWVPAGLGAAIGALFALVNNPKKTLPTGMTTYMITRTILNGTRSVEPLIMAIVGVIWVGIGPFAGVLALALHTVAALSKLYSEQVESISEGPLEAIKATGATRIQTIIYGVLPQIVPPYISFTMYRWDINVRMSTVIGLVGGGGIGTLLIQNINLLNYRDASVQMVAIAVVVASMDYLSSSMRERFV